MSETQIGSRAFIFDTGIRHACISYGFIQTQTERLPFSRFLDVIRNLKLRFQQRNGFKSLDKTKRRYFLVKNNEWTEKKYLNISLFAQHKISSCSTLCCANYPTTVALNLTKNFDYRMTIHSIFRIIMKTKYLPFDVL